MSLPFYTVACTGCTFDDRCGYAARFVYEGKADRQPVMLMSWCQDCDEIGHMCAPFTRKPAEYELADLKSWIDRNRSGMFARFSKSKRNAIVTAEEEIRAIESRLTYFEHTTYEERCLKCGGRHVFPIDLPYGEYGQPEDIGVTHSCGGQLRATMEGRISYGQGPRVGYDEAGGILFDERTRPPSPAEVTLEPRIGESHVNGR